MAQGGEAEQRQLIGAQPETQGNRQLVALGGEEAAHHHAEAELTAVGGRQERQIVVQQKAVGSSAHGDVELAGQVAGRISRQQALLNRLHQGAGIHDLLGIDPRQGVAGDVAGVVVPGLAAGEPHRLHGLHQGCHVFQQQAAQLQVLAGGDIGRAVLTAAIHRIRQHLQLVSVDHAIGQAQPHHEAPRRHRPEEDAQPLEPNRERGLIQVVPTLSRKLTQPRRQFQAAQFSLGLLNLAQSGGHHGIRLGEATGCSTTRARQCRHRYQTTVPGEQRAQGLPAPVSQN